MISLEQFGATFTHTKIRDKIDHFHFEKKGLPIHIRIMFQAGSLFDEVPGTAHFLEHMLVAGSKKYPTKDLLSKRIEEYGGYFAASTGTDYIVFDFEIGEKIDINILEEIIQEIILHPKFDDTTLERERKSIIAEIQNKNSNPNQFVWDVYRIAFFENSELMHTGLGTEENVNTITKEDLINFYQKYIISGKVTLFSAGDCSSKSISSIFEKIHFGIDSIKDISQRFSLPQKSKVSYKFYNSKQAHLICGMRTQPENLFEYICNRLLISLLAQGRSSRLITKLRYESGLVYSIGGSSRLASSCGTLSVSTSCDIKNFESVLQNIDREFQSIAREGITEEEFRFIKNKFKKSAAQSLQTSEDWINMHEVF